MAQSFYPITPVEVSPGSSGSWQDCDVSAHIPVGATGVILRLKNTEAWDNDMGVRKNGSTDDRWGTFGDYGHTWAMVGVDASRIFEAKIESTTYCHVYLVGYTMAGVTFATNGADKSPGAVDWTDIDCSTEAPSAVGLIFEITSSSEYDFGLRKNGSSDDRYLDVFQSHCLGAVIGCDGSQLCEGKCQSANLHLFLLGYITAGAVFNTNATDVSLGSTGSWLDLAALPLAGMGIFQVIDTASSVRSFGLRKNGSGGEDYGDMRSMSWAVVEADAAYLVEGKIEYDTIDMFLVGCGVKSDSVTPAAASAVATVVAPTVPASYTVTPAAASAIATVVDPTVDASCTVTPSPAAATAGSALAWYDLNWPYQVDITIDHTKVVTETQTDFAVHLDEHDLPDHFWNNVKADGTDIVLTLVDGHTKLKREVVSIDTSGKTLELHVAIPDLSYTVDTALRLYYGYAEAAETNDEDTWDEWFTFVSHMNDDPDSSHIKDSTANHNHGTKIGANQPVEAAGAIGKAQDHDGLNDVIEGPSSNDITGDNLQTITFEIIVKHTDTGDNGYIASLKRSGIDSTLISLDAGHTGAGKLGFLTRTYDDSAHTWLDHDGSYNDGAWHHLVAVVNGLARILYVDGAQRNNDNVGMQSVTGNTAKFTIGAFSASATFFDGLTDECRISICARSPGHIATTRNTLLSPATFYSVGSVHYAGFVRLGSTSKEPAAAPAIAAVLAPTTVLGSLSLSPSAAAAPAATVAPAVVTGSITVPPTAATALAASSDPTLHFTSTTASPATSLVIAATLDPAVLLGGTTSTPGAAAGVAATDGPTVATGPIIVTPAAAEVLAATAGPVVYTGVSITLLEAQKNETIDALIKLVLTHNGSSYTYTRDRILACDHDEQPYTQTAAVVLDNSDGELTDLDLKGFQGVISYGAVTSLGDEYQATAPLWVTGQQLDSSPGELACTLQLHGIPDRLSLDKASAVYAPTDTDTKTVKDLIGEILGATIACYNHCQAYTVEWDSEDSLIDSYQPKDTFRIYLNSSRMAVLRKLLDYTKCTLRVQDDGKVHIFQPQISGEAYDYEYSLARGEHAFFSKAYRNRLVMPNYIHVQTPTYAAVQYSGVAQDAESVAAIGEIRYYVRTYLISNAQGTGIAEAVLSKYQLQASTGKATVPLNALARVFDYVRVTDARQEDERAGSVGYLARHYKAGRRGSTWEMDFGFGNWLSMQRLLNNLELASDLSYDFLRLNVKNLNAEKITAGDIDVDTLSAICAYLGDVSVASGDVTIGSAGIKLFGENLYIYDGAVKAGSLYESGSMVRLAGWNGYGVRILTEAGEGADIVLQADGDLDLGAGGIIDLTDPAETDDLDAATTAKCIGKTTFYDEIHANDLYGATHCYDEHDDLALIKQLRPCDDNPSLIATPSLPEFLRPSREYALAREAQGLQEKEERQKALIFARIQEEKDPQVRARLQLKLEAVGADRQARLDAFADHFDADLAREASVSKTVFFAIGAIKQVAHQLDAINARLAALEEARQ